MTWGVCAYGQEAAIIAHTTSYAMGLYIFMSVHPCYPMYRCTSKRPWIYTHKLHIGSIRAEKPPTQQCYCSDQLPDQGGCLGCCSTPPPLPLVLIMTRYYFVNYCNQKRTHSKLVSVILSVHLSLGCKQAQKPSQQPS